jgi:hypothetical protein
MGYKARSDEEGAFAAQTVITARMLLDLRAIAALARAHLGDDVKPILWKRMDFEFSISSDFETDETYVHGRTRIAVDGMRDQDWSAIFGRRGYDEPYKTVPLTPAARREPIVVEYTVDS